MIRAKILSLNSGIPAPMAWEGKTINSSMLRHPVPGPLLVHHDRIEDNSFGSPEFHGVEHSVLYAYGMPSALDFVRLLGQETYIPGAVGENVTLDRFDETEVCVGDEFQFGEVLAQVTWPRVPCGKVNFRMQHPRGQKAMQDCGRSGVYFRILKPGKIFRDSEVVCVKQADQRLPIFEVYRSIVRGEELSPQQLRVGLATGALPKRSAEKWQALLS